MSRAHALLGFTIVLLLALVVGCSSAAPAPQAAAPTAAPQAAAPTTAPAAAPAAKATEAPKADAAKAAPASGEPVTIEYWQYNFPARIEAMNELIKQFEAANPGIKVVHNSDIPYDNFQDKIAASAPAGVGPDVATLFYGWLPKWVEAGYLVPLPEKDFPPAQIEKEFSPMVQAGKFQGKYWTIPTAVRTLALFWNKDMFKAAGLDPEKPPTTVEEFAEMAQKLTKRDGDKITQQGFPVEMTGQAHQWFREVLTRQWGVEPFSADNKKLNYGSPQACEAWKWLTDFETKYKTGSNDLFDGATTAFTNGKAALHIDGSFRLGALAKATGLNFGVAPLPTRNGVQANFGSYWTHGLTKKAAADPKRLEASTKFLKFITSPEAGKLWVEKTGELPAQLSAANDPALLKDPKLGAFAQSLPYSHATFFVDEAKQRQNLIDAFDAIRLQGADPCKTLADAVAKDQALYDEFWAKIK